MTGAAACERTQEVYIWVHDHSERVTNKARRKKDKLRGHSSAGRAPALHAGGRRFDPVWLHHLWLHATAVGRVNDELLINKFFTNRGSESFCSLTIWKKFLTF